MKTVRSKVGSVLVRFAAIALTLQVLLLTAQLSATPALADAPPSIDWVRQFGTGGEDNVSAVATDADGNVYAAGSTTGSFPGYTNIWGLAAFVSKFSSSGAALWTRQYSAGFTTATSVAVDAAGNVYIGGQNDYGFPFPGQTSAFLQKYDPSGQEVWNRQFGNYQEGFGIQGVSGLTVDAQGNIYVAGYMPGTVYLDFDTDTEVYTYMGQENDGFLGKYDSLGNQLWMRLFVVEGAAATYANAVSTDGAGNPLVTGSSTDFGGVSQAFARKYDAAGTQLWQHLFGTPQGTQAYGIGGAYVAGYTAGSLPLQTSSGLDDAFVRKIDSSGIEAWTRQFGTSGSDRASAAALDAAGNALVAGDTTGAFPGEQNAGPAGSTDGYARKYDSTGGLLWTLQFGTDNIDHVSGIAAYGAKTIFVGGQTNSTFAGESHYGPGTRDAFIVRLVASGGFTPGDVNQDGPVNLSDLMLVATSFGKHTADAGFNANADLNTDGVVNILDLVQVGLYFGT